MGGCWSVVYRSGKGRERYVEKGNRRKQCIERGMGGIGIVYSSGKGGMEKGRKKEKGERVYGRRDGGVYRSGKGRKEEVKG